MRAIDRLPLPPPSANPCLPLPALPCTQIAHNAGLSATFVNPNKPGLGAVTVTGWVAVLCVGALVAVVLGMLGFALWRATLGSQQHRYTQLVREGGPLKEGDV